MEFYIQLFQKSLFEIKNLQIILDLVYLLVKHHCLVLISKVKGNCLLLLFSCE